MAGMTAALKLLQAGFSVRLIEASDGVGGQFGARLAKRDYQDFAWHVFAGWCVNFWEIAETIGLSEERDFVARPTLTLLRPFEGPSRRPRASSVSYVGSPEFFWTNLTSGVADWSDLLLFTHSMYALLCDQSLEKEEFLNRVPVNAYMRGLHPMSDVAALLHNELLLRIWAIPSYLISARSYQTYLQLIAPFTYPSSPVVVLKKNFEEGFWAPFRDTLRRLPSPFTLTTGARLTGIRLGPGGRLVDEIVVKYKSEAAPRVEKVNRLIVAIPPESLVRVLSDAESSALRDTEAGRDLLDLAKLPTQQTSALTLYFKRSIGIPGPEPVALVDHFEDMYAPDTLSQRNGLASAYGLSFLDVASLWKADHPTILSVLASDAESLMRLDDDEACRCVITELRRFIRFDDRDIDWDYSHFQAHRGERLFVNAVGSWEYRPEVRTVNSEGQALTGQIWQSVHNLYLAGDYCRSRIDIVSLEGAAHTGIWAAHALSGRAVAQGHTGVRIVPPPRPPVDWDPAPAQRILGQLRRWLGLADARSRRVATEIKLLQKESPPTVSRPATGAAPASGSTNTAGPGGRAMSKALSTFPGFSSPTSPEQTGWLNAKYRDHLRQVTLKSGASAGVPLLFWESRALKLLGTGDGDAIDSILAAQSLRSVRVDASGAVETPGGSYAQVNIWAPDYAGTTVGPIKAVFASIWVEPRATCPTRHRDPKLPHFWWWWYYGNSVVNSEFKRDVWGIPNELGMLEMTYQTPMKAVRLLHEGRMALRLRADLSKTPDEWIMLSEEELDKLVKGNPDKKKESEIPGTLNKLSEGATGHEQKLGRWRVADRDARHKMGARPRETPGTTPFRFVAVSRRSTDEGENDVEMFGAVKFLKYDEARDEYHVGKDTAVGKQLESVDFKPQGWEFYPSYNGVVEIFDEKGGSERPKHKDEERAQTIGDRLISLIPEIEDRK